MDEPLFEREFGRSYRIPKAILKMVNTGELVDTSWHNDSCPTFTTPLTPVGSVSLWVNHPNPRTRQIEYHADADDAPHIERYGVGVNGTCGDIVWDMPTDDLRTAIRVLREKVAEIATAEGLVTD